MYLQGSLNLELSGGSHHEVPPESFFQGLGNLVRGARWTADEVAESVTLVAFAHSVSEVFHKLGAIVLRIGFGNRTIFEDSLGLSTFQDAISALDSFDFPHNDAGLELNLSYRWDDGVLNTVFNISFARVHLARTEAIHIRATAVPSGLRREPYETSKQFTTRVARLRLPGQSYLKALLDAKLVRIAQDLEAYHRVRTASHGVVPHQGTLSQASIQSRSDYNSQFYGYDSTYDLAYLWMMDDIRDERRRDHSDGFVFAGHDSLSSSDAASASNSTGTDAGNAIGDFIGDSISGGFDAGGSDFGGGDGGGGSDGGGGGGD